MAARRPSTVCHFCRSCDSANTRRRVLHITKRSFQAVALRHDEGDELVAHREHTEGSGGEENDSNGSPKSVLDTVRQWKLHSEAMLAFEAFVKTKDRRVQALRNLSNPWPVIHEMHNITNGHSSAKDKLALPEAQAAPVPHATFKVLLRAAHGVKPIRQVLRAQLLQVQHPKDLLRIVAVAMHNRVHAEQLVILHEPVMRSLYRCRNTVTDPEILGTISTVVSRFRIAGLVPHVELLTLGMKFAARARSVAGMKKYLRLMHDRRSTMTSNVFRSVIAKFSIGHRGLGEIRNGRWRRADLMQVLTGFDDCKHLPPDQQYHLGTFLERDDWQFLHGWVAVLARCKASDAVWDEWELWKQNDSRLVPKILECTGSYMNTRNRGDYWFVEQMVHSDDVQRGWRILEDSEIPLNRMKDRVRIRLLDEVEHASIWTPQLTEAMLDKYDKDLSRIEKAFGVTWIADTNASSGQHVLFRDQEEALDELGSQDWKHDGEDYGFMLNDEDTLLTTQERSLHDAEETEPVKNQRN